METVKLSIVIPAYNVEKYIDRCLDSIANQTFRDFEVVIVDDGSTDNTYSLIQKYCQKDPRFHHYHKENGGQMSAYLLGLKHVGGEYIGFVDPDDTIEPNMYESMLVELEKNDCDICVCDFNQYDCNTNELIIRGGGEYRLIAQEDMKEFYKMVLPSPYGTGVSMSRVNKVFKRHIIMDNIKYCEMDISRVMEDRRIVPACLWSCQRIAFLGKPFYNVYVNRAGSTSRKFIPELLDIIKKIHDIQKTELMDKGIFELCESVYNASLIDFARIYLCRNVYNNNNHFQKIKYCRRLVLNEDMRREVFRFHGKCDKTLLSLKIAMKLKSGFILYLLALLKHN